MKDYKEGNVPYFTMAALSAQQICENFLITIEYEDGFVKFAEFSPERECVRVQGLELIESDGMNQYLNLDLDGLINQLGQPHADVGSGFYIPAYITADANLACFQIEDKTVKKIIMRDLLTGRQVGMIS